MENLIEDLTTQIKDNEAQINSIKKQLVTEIAESKPKLTLDFLTNRELVNNEDPILAKQSQDSIKVDLKELNKLIDYLWK
jgi:hypothetical protein